jgi:hypothetical protein
MVDYNHHTRDWVQESRTDLSDAAPYSILSDASHFETTSTCRHSRFLAGVQPDRSKPARSPLSTRREPHGVKPSSFVRYGLLSTALLLSACCFFGRHRARTDALTHLNGSLSVAPAYDFVYAPAAAGRVSPNRIENTAMSSITLKKNIDVCVHDAVAINLKRAGLDTADSKRVLTARIETFSVEDARSPAWWTLTLRYSLVDADTKRVLYMSTKTVRQEFRTFTNNTIALEDIVRANVATLLDDPEFAQAVH